MQGGQRGDYLKVLGYKYVDEIVNRDDLVLMKDMDKDMDADG